MHHFQIKKGELYAEDVPVSRLAEAYGTPLYVYSAATIAHHYDRLTQALAPLDHLICYAVKANSNLAVLKLLAQRGSGFDLVSGGELTRVQKAGGKAGKCSFAGVGKTRDEIEQAIAQGVYVFNVESIAEMDFINRIAAEKRKTAPIALRVNPNVDAKTHAKITTGTYENKFGIAFEEVGALYARAAKLKNLRLLGVQMHIGSQITEVNPFVQAVRKMLPLVEELKKLYQIEFFDIGGGLGIVYDPALASGQASWWRGQKKPPLTPSLYAEKLVPLLKPLGLRILLEPGRFMVGNAGALVTEVLYLKKNGAQDVRDRRCRDERPDPTGVLRLLPRDRAAEEEARGQAGEDRRGGAGVRVGRLFCEGPSAAAPGGGRPTGAAQRGSLRLRHGLELQHPAARGGGAGGRSQAPGGAKARDGRRPVAARVGLSRRFSSSPPISWAEPDA